MELTPEMCNDLLKFITPPLFQATRTSGKVSLELDQFSWPLGKPDAAQLNGRLTLHSVDVVPGPVTQLLNSILQNKAAPLALQIAKDDVVAFNMHDGRVYHENLTFRLAAMQVELLVHSHGSVGLDESLDWFVEFQFPGLEAADLTGHPFMKLLSQQPAAAHHRHVKPAPMEAGRAGDASAANGNRIATAENGRASPSRRRRDRSRTAQGRAAPFPRSNAPVGAARRFHCVDDRDLVIPAQWLAARRSLNEKTPGSHPGAFRVFINRLRVTLRLSQSLASSFQSLSRPSQGLASSSESSGIINPASLATCHPLRRRTSQTSCDSPRSPFPSHRALRG